MNVSVPPILLRSPVIIQDVMMAGYLVRSVWVRGRPLQRTCPHCHGRGQSRMSALSRHWAHQASASRAVDRPPAVSDLRRQRRYRLSLLSRHQKSRLSCLSRAGRSMEQRAAGICRRHPAFPDDHADHRYTASGLRLSGPGALCRMSVFSTADRRRGLL